MIGALEELRNMAVNQELKERLMMAVCKVAVQTVFDVYASILEVPVA